MVRIDFHVHSKFSKRPSAWFLRKIGCPECFTEPVQIYRIARQRGMTHVTITDHNSIQGALAIAHLPDTFISEEITTYFPDDHCKIHVLAYDISEKQHADIQKFRADIFDLSAYLRQEKIFHALAHPLYRMNERLTLDHIEKLWLLFRVFELNGARGDASNECLIDLEKRMTPDHLMRLADKHGIHPVFPEPWHKTFIGGSDDHSSLNIARTHTEIENADALETAFETIHGDNTRVVRLPAEPHTMAHNLYGIAYQYYRDKFNLNQYVNNDRLVTFLDHSLRSGAAAEDPRFFSRLGFLWHHRHPNKNKNRAPETLMHLLRRESNKMLEDNPELTRIAQNKSTDLKALERNWFDFVNQASNRVLYHFANPLIEHLVGANVFDIFQTIGSAGGLYTLMAPYFIAFSIFGRDRRFAQEIRHHFANHSSKQPGPSESINVAHFTDTFYDVNGVALSLQEQVNFAVQNHKNYQIITCHENPASSQLAVKNFKPIGVYELPEYPEQKLYYPPLLEMLDFCYRKGFNKLHSATPGPIGLAALAIARILDIPIYGTYHTSLPQYARILTGDHFIEELVWKFTLWYYDQMDTVYTPSSSTGEELIQKGIAASKIRLFPRGIDIQRFHPSKRNGFLESRYHIRDARTLLYVGRVSKEKNLHLLANAFRALYQKYANIHLIIVGEGPFLEEMQTIMADAPCTFTGYLKGEDLASIFASSDIFVFPSTTDTFGNVVLEAQASGLPVIVTDKGGPHENIIPGATGLIAKADEADSLTAAIQTLLDDPSTMRRMGQAARNYMEARSFDAAFAKTWQMYQERSVQTDFELADIA